jgi:SAM-dependent methyltransferase
MADRRTANMWDERYREAGYAFGDAPNDFLRVVAPLIPAGPVLSLAEGEGRNAIYLASLGYAVTGVDQSAVGLQKAQDLASARGVKIQTIVADLAEFAIESAAWAGIISIFGHLPPSLRRQVYPAVVAGLRPGGVLSWKLMDQPSRATARVVRATRPCSRHSAPCKTSWPV